MEERQEGIKAIMGGDFNARPGEEGRWGEGEEREEGKGKKIEG